MKKIIVTVMIVWISAGCNEQQSKKNENTAATDSTDTIISKPKAESGSTELKSKDSVLLRLSNEILAVLKTKNFTKLATFVHPVLGVRFSPYAFVDTIHHQRLLPAELIKLNQQKKMLVWGTRDGTGEAIKEDINKYFAEFVYDEDFLTAPQRAINKTLAKGNSLNNLNSIYPAADFTEFYFPGFDPQYGGMDWKTLRLVFQTDNTRTWLIAIIHDQWTI